MKKILSFNSREVIEGTDYRRDKGNNLWIDVIDPSLSELVSLQQEFCISIDKLKMTNPKSKGKCQQWIRWRRQQYSISQLPLIRILDNYSLTTLSDLQYRTNGLIAKEIYIFLGKYWILTIHPSKVELTIFIRTFIEQKILEYSHNKNKPMNVTVEDLYQHIHFEIIARYKRTLISLESEIQQSEKNYIQKGTSRDILEYFYHMINQTIFLRRYAWYTRNILNFLMHTKEDDEEKKVYAHIYRDMNELIKQIESLKNKIHRKSHFYGRVYRFKT